jgi:hypothetical protein
MTEETINPSKTQTFYALVHTSNWGNSYVRAKGLEYASMSPVPSLFPDARAANIVWRKYKELSKNCGKQPTSLKLVVVTIDVS